MNPPAPFESGGFRQLEDEFLPIFSRKADDLTLFYAPGFLAAAGERDAERICQLIAGEIPFGNPTAGYLINSAVSAQDEWRRIHDLRFYEPVCLTVYSSLACNLNCSYCFAKQEHALHAKLDRELFLDAAWNVAFNCNQRHVPFTAVFHGGGEPSLDPRLPALLEELNKICVMCRIPLHTYMATNGVMNAEKARWIAEHFDEVGLSVDGPPDIQNAQRPLRGGGESSAFVERTADVFRKIKGRLTVRVTVPPENFGRIREIADYCADKLSAGEIHIEPVYNRGAGPDAELADAFCENFLAAKQDGHNLTFSGSRVGEIHGRYCQVFRQVLHTVPPKGYSPCFVVSSESEAKKNFPDFDPEDASDMAMLAAEDPACGECFNRYHCARGCPDVCPGLPGRFRDAGTFRCRVNRKLAEAELLETARRALFIPARQYGYAGIKLRGD